MEQNEWFDEGVADEIGQVDEYDIISSPNDFNLLTLQSFVEAGAIKIPGFQRNYVWDKQRASKLIESLIIGIPVPQLFLYEESKNNFLVVDGQQRLMTIYYFYKQRFPRKDKRSEIRKVFDENNGIPEIILQDDTYFEKFNLTFSSQTNNSANKFKGLNYSTLGDHKTQFDFRTLRNIVVRQNNPAGDDSSIYEVFNRLNTGSVNLRPQEIRTSMYHSEFYMSLNILNLNAKWRTLLRQPQADLHAKDIEIILRAFAFLISGDEYKPSLVKFLNTFSAKSRRNDANQNKYLTDLFLSFIDAAENLTERSLINPRNERFNVSLFEAVFHATCYEALREKRLLNGQINPDEVLQLASDEEFQKASIEGTTRSDNVEKRLRIAKQIVSHL